MNRLSHILLILGLTTGAGFSAIFKVPGSQQNANHTAASWTNDYANTAVAAGDVVVIQAATNKRRSATDYTAEILTSSALLSPPQVIQSLADSHPGSHLFYYEVLYPGTVDFRVAASTNSTGISALYVLRSDIGAKIETASIRQLEQAIEGTNSWTHTFAAPASGFLVETFSAASDTIVSRTLDPQVDEDLVEDFLGKRFLTGGTFTNATNLTSSYVVTNTRHSAISLALTEGEPPPPKPNVLFIAIDDLNPLLGSYGDSIAKTPNMDALAARGMLFENAHCQWSVCGPSRASLMTGLMPEQGGVMGFTKMRGDGVNDARDNPLGLPNLITLPQYFIGHGYATAAVGKLNDNRCVGSINPDGTINEDGNTADDPPSWSHSFDNPSGIQPESANRTTDGLKIKRAAESVDAAATEFVDGKIATRALTVLDELAAGDAPFFLGVGFKKPHLPFLAPKSSWDEYQRSDFDPHPFQVPMTNATPYTFNAVMELRNSYYFETNNLGQALPIPATRLSDEEQRFLLHGYYACISHIDEQIGRVVNHLDTLNLATNTIIVLWGDHGFHLGDHNEWGKHTNLEQATRVPFMIAAPGFPSGQRTIALAYQFSRATRHPDEARGSERLKGTAPLPPPSNRALPGLTITTEHVAWPHATGLSYTLRSKTNLNDAAWTTEQSNLNESPAAITPGTPRKYYQVEVDE